MLEPKMRATIGNWSAGFAYGGALIGVVCTIIALFNLAVRLFDLTLSAITQPIISAYRSAFRGLLDWAHAEFGLPLPQWHHDHMLLYFALGSVVAGILSHGVETRSELPPRYVLRSIYTSLFAIGFFVPGLNLLFLCAIYFYVAVFAFWPVAQFMHPERWRGKIRAVGLYVWGIGAGLCAALSLNWLY